MGLCLPVHIQKIIQLTQNKVLISCFTTQEKGIVFFHSPSKIVIRNIINVYCFIVFILITLSLSMYFLQGEPETEFSCD